MLMKGLLEWKILAAVFAILIVASSALVSNSGIKDTFLNSTGNIGDWLGGSPFGSLFQTPQKEMTWVKIDIKSGQIGLVMESPVNITSDSSSIKNFKGDMNIDFDTNSSQFILSGTDFVMDTKIERMKIEGVRISSLVLDNIDYVVESEKSSVTGTDDRLEIHDFAGDITIDGSLMLEGNVSVVKNGKWTISDSLE